MKYTKKQILYAHVIEARKQKELYDRRSERFEELGEIEKAGNALKKALDFATREQAFVEAITIVYGEFGCDLEQELSRFAKEMN